MSDAIRASMSGPVKSSLRVLVLGLNLRTMAYMKFGKAQIQSEPPPYSFQDFSG